MFQRTILFAVALLYFVQCLPLDLSTHKETSSSSQLHLFVDNSSKSTNYHLTPLWDAMENVDEEIDKQLGAVLPYLNFFFDTLLGPSTPNDEDCSNSMVIQLVPENAEPHTKKAKSQSPPHTEGKPDEKVVTVIKGNDNDKSKSQDQKENKPINKPDTIPEESPDKKVVTVVKDNDNDKPSTKSDEIPKDSPQTTPEVLSTTTAVPVTSSEASSKPPATD